MSAVVREIDNGQIAGAVDHRDVLEPLIAFDVSVPPKGDLASMELPLFALRAGERCVRVYEDDHQRVEVIPSVLGAATQRDKDVLLYCVSHLVSARNRGCLDRHRTVRTTIYSILEFCQRSKGGKDYKRLAESLARLRGTTICTDRETGGRQIKEGFGLIESFRIERDTERSERAECVEIRISEWLRNAIEANEILSINRAYFAITSDFERRIYELARKHCGRQPTWNVSVERLWCKSGSRSKLPEFRRKLDGIARKDSLPDYRVVVDRASDQAQFYAKSPGGAIAQIQRSLRGIPTSAREARPVRNLGKTCE
jgi:plasmid replication initiation protein